MECAVFAVDVSFGVLNLMSDNPGMRWDLTQTRQAIGYAPRDGHVAVSTPAIDEHERLARLQWDVIARFEQMSAKW
jgi:NAD+ dependent glucose-6-phosphate dehydrogenase